MWRTRQVVLCHRWGRSLHRVKWMRYLLYAQQSASSSPIAFVFLKQNEYRGLVEITLENISDCVEDACEDFVGFESDLAVRLLRVWLFVNSVTDRYTNVG